MKETEILETKEIQMCEKKVIIEMKKISNGKFSYLRPFARLEASERQSFQYWRQAYLEIERELIETKRKNEILKEELLKFDDAMKGEE